MSRTLVDKNVLLVPGTVRPEINYFDVLVLDLFSIQKKKVSGSVVLNGLRRVRARMYDVRTDERKVISDIR